MKHTEVFELLRSGDVSELARLLSTNPAAARARDDRGLSALMTALYSHRFDMADVLRVSAAPLDLFEAAAVGDADRVREMVKADATALETHGVDGFTALHLACYFGRDEAVAVLLEHGADPVVPARNPTRMHALHSAVAARRPDLVTALIAHGAEVDATQRGGWTALHAAARHGDTDSLRLLIAAGADRELRADSGEAARDLLPPEASAEVRDVLAESG